jgi:hypothetical protein
MPPPASEQAINELSKVTVTQDNITNDSPCSICQEDFKLGEQVPQLPCKHLFHEECVVPWLKLNGTCPVCRSKLEPDAEPSQAPASSANPTQSTHGTPPVGVRGSFVLPTARFTFAPNQTNQTTSSTSTTSTSRTSTSTNSSTTRRQLPNGTTEVTTTTTTTTHRPDEMPQVDTSTTRTIEGVPQTNQDVGLDVD